MYKDSKRTCTAIVLVIKTFVWWRSRCRRRRGLLKLPSWVMRKSKQPSLQERKRSPWDSSLNRPVPKPITVRTLEP